MKKIIVFGVVIVIIAAAVWFFFLREPAPQTGTQPGTARVVESDQQAVQSSPKQTVGTTFQPIQTKEDIQKIINFLTDFCDNVGFTYQGTASELNGLTLPLSYYNTADYWGKYVCKIPDYNCKFCKVIDTYHPTDYTLTPDLNDPIGSPGSKLQIERVDVNFGTDIYDAACWQIAIALAANNGLKGVRGQPLGPLPYNEAQLLEYGYDGNAANAHPNDNRAITKGKTFVYNGITITDPTRAYFFRMITRNWLSTDPFMGTPYESCITAKNLPPGESPYKRGLITWMDWKPITGENAWAFLIGPLQSAYIKDVASGNQKYVPFNSQEVQSAIKVLYAFRVMQSEIGAIYYAPSGTSGNQGEPVNPYEVSVENNASTLAGLWILQGILNQELKNETDLSSQDKNTINQTLGYIDVMINGGPTIQGRTTKGLLAFFQNYAWDPNNKEFLQGGLANAPNQPEWQSTTEPKAVDVNTWGITVLGAKRVDNWFGEGSSYNIWQNVKSWGGYFGGGTSGDIWGVGYSDDDNHSVFSAEWTAGAINMVRSLIVYYSSVGKSEYVTSLQADERSMLTKLMDLRTDNYPNVSNFKDRPPDWASLVPIPADKLAFVYSQKRYFIPFGWYGNPLPSTTSSSWPVMLYYNYNPFKLGGGY